MPASVPVRPLTRVTLVDATMEQIRAAIDAGGLQAGDRLPSELEWSRQLQVSRPVVREAVGRLQSLGMLQVSPGRGRGMVVGSQDAVLSGARLVASAMSISPKQLQQFNEFRAALEIYAVRRAAEVATAEQVAHLEQLCERLDEPTPTSEQAIEADFRFHRAIVEILDNQVMLHTLEVSQEIIKHCIRHARRRNRGRKLDSRRLHRRIVDAIRRHDPDAAERAMTEHIFDDTATLEPASRPAASHPTPRSKRRSKTALTWLLAATLTLAALPLSATEPQVPQTLDERLRAEPLEKLAHDARTQGDPQRGAIVFHQAHLACLRCHSTGGETKALGPDLARLPSDTTPEHLIESLLDPSKQIRHGYEAIVIELQDGTAFTGLFVSEDNLKLVVRDVGEQGTLREIPLDQIAARETATLSIMPAAQANLLAGRHEFLDLVAYLVEIARGGPERAAELAPPESLYAPPPSAPDTSGSAPQVYRTMMPESGPGALAIGLGSDIWVCFDPNRGGVNYAWHGSLDLAPTLQQKINQPANVVGTLFYRDAVTGPIRPGNADKIPPVRFLGYRFENGGVVVRYRADHVTIEETLSARPEGVGIVRRLQCTGGDSPLWLLADEQSQSHVTMEGAMRVDQGWKVESANPATVVIRIEARPGNP